MLGGLLHARPGNMVVESSVASVDCSGRAAALVQKREYRAWENRNNNDLSILTDFSTSAVAVSANLDKWSSWNYLGHRRLTLSPCKSYRS